MKLSNAPLKFFVEECPTKISIGQYFFYKKKINLSKNKIDISDIEFIEIKSEWKGKSKFKQKNNKKFINKTLDTKMGTDDCVKGVVILKGFQM